MAWQLIPFFNFNNWNFPKMEFLLQLGYLNRMSLSIIGLHV